MSLRKHRAFALVELLSLIAIIAILAALFVGVVPAAIGGAKKLSSNVSHGQTSIINGFTSDDK
jgi:type II secretory pathway pseudopilin PulG